VLRGNHDQLFLDVLTREGDPDPTDLSWLDPRIGGRATLASYGVTTGGFRNRRTMLRTREVRSPRRTSGF
jgi:serine/threonine protein phosphatase 1